ncbi:MAG: type II toxin-antitoxin system mRNA interferase toxin, RelE/StbE family [Deltaproteobacteria bacterium]|nr:type II toxin-antitoxin system mRNA interferase toxin, RelE/StbE family [Deltaproteobacteria bacterium]
MKAEIVESKKAQKDLDKAPRNVAASYEIWARLVEEHGLDILRSFKGYHDEKLLGELKNMRSSRLNKKWRVVYQRNKQGMIEIVCVVRVIPHDYRKL